MAGRKRSPLAGSGPHAELAQRLRNLRDASGLTLRQLAAKSGYSSAALSYAENARGLPSWELLTAFVQTCGEDPVQWRQLWELTRIAPAVPGQAVALTQADPGGSGPDKPSKRWYARRWIPGAVTAAIAASTVMIFWSVAPWPHSSEVALAGPPVSAGIAARDNTDPYADGCKHDEKRLDSRKVYRRNGSLYGMIVLVYSAGCQAEWGYLDGPNSSAWTIYIISRRLPGPGATQWHFSGNMPYGSWGNVLSTERGCVYTEAYVKDKDGAGPRTRTACIQP